MYINNAWVESKIVMENVTFRSKNIIMENVVDSVRGLRIIDYNVLFFAPLPHPSPSRLWP